MPESQLGQQIIIANLCWHRVCCFFSISLSATWASPVAHMVKNLPAVQETRVQPLGQEDPLEKGMATHFSILAWRIPWTEQFGRLQFMESTFTLSVTYVYSWSFTVWLQGIFSLQRDHSIERFCPILISSTEEYIVCFFPSGDISRKQKIQLSTPVLFSVWKGKREVKQLTNTEYFSSPPANCKTLHWWEIYWIQKWQMDQHPQSRKESCFGAWTH